MNGRSAPPVEKRLLLVDQNDKLSNDLPQWMFIRSRSAFPSPEFVMWIREKRNLGFHIFPEKNQRIPKVSFVSFEFLIGGL
jgi:hypothetical protein